MSENIDLYGLLADALDKHVSRGETDTYGPAFTDFKLDTDVEVFPTFDHRVNTGGVVPGWDGTTGTRSYMFLVMADGVNMRGSTPEGRMLETGEILVYQTFSAEPKVSNEDGHISYEFDSLDYHTAASDRPTQLSLYDLLALTAAQDAYVIRFE